jgi:hypothetical protein
MYLRQVNHARITENEFIANTAGRNSGWGGGISLYECTDVSLSGNRFERNVAALPPSLYSWGGGAQVTRGGFITLTNNVFVGNRATTAGSGLAISNSTSLLLHTTFAGNSGGNGSALEVAATRSAGSSASLVNTIMFSHSMGITVGQGCTVTLVATLWQGTRTLWMGAGSVASTGYYDGDPRFAADGYHLRAGSAALDIGVDAEVRTDIDGDPRPLGAGYDLGADELWPTIYLPVVVRSRTYP